MSLNNTTKHSYHTVQIYRKRKASFIKSLAFSHIYAEMNNPDIINLVIFWLHGKSIKQARLVNKEWNAQALPLLWRELSFSFCKETVLGSTFPEFMDEHPNIETKIFSSVNISNSQKEPEQSCFRYLEKIHISNTLRRIVIDNLAHISWIGQAASKGLFPNLEELHVPYLTKVNADNLVPLEPLCLPKLRVLLVFHYDLFTLDSEYHSFWQSVINSAPNIVKLRLSLPLNISGLTRLADLDVAVPETLTPENSDILNTMLQAVASSLRKLSLFAFSSSPGALCPSLPNLCSLELIITMEAGRYNFLPSFAKNLPNMRRLKIKVFQSSEVESPKAIIGCEKRDLDFLEILHYGISGHVHLAEWLQVWAGFMSTVGTLVVVAPTERRQRFDLEDWIDAALSLALPTNVLVLKFEENYPISVILKNFYLADFPSLVDGIDCKVLEIHNALGDPMPDLYDKQKDIQRFSVVMKKLLKRWNRIHFRNFKVPELFQNEVLQYVTELYPAVEMYSFAE